jgi:hypothetical protein
MNSVDDLSLSHCSELAPPSSYWQKALTFNASESDDLALPPPA